MAKQPPERSPTDETEPGSLIPLHLTDSERITYQKSAERCGLSLEVWIRTRLSEVAKREAKDS